MSRCCGVSSDEKVELRQLLQGQIQEVHMHYWCGYLATPAGTVNFQNLRDVIEAEAETKTNLQDQGPGPYLRD